jgi:DNA-binding IclR family transcriptional regulator
MTEKLPAAPEDDSGEATVKTIDRAARLLRAVATHGDGAMLSAVARETGLGKGTVHRLLNALVDAGFVFQESETKRYRLGAGLGLLGQAAHRHDLAALARPSLLRLAELTQDTLFASLREGASAVCVAREIGAFPIRTLSLDAGHVRPLGVGSGSLALLAFQPDEEIATIIDRNAAWLAKYPAYNRKVLLADVAETRRRGYSFVDGRIVPGMNAMGVPVLDERGRAVAALSLAAIADRVSGARIAELARLLTQEAATWAKAMGLPPPPALPKRARGA